MCKHHELRSWCRAESKRRKAAVDAGTAPVDWVLKEYRITWTEVLIQAAEFGLQVNDPVGLRLWWGRAQGAMCPTCGEA